MLRFTVFVIYVCFTMVIVQSVLIEKLRQGDDINSNVVGTSRVLYDEEHSPCKTDIGSTGVCVDIRLCHTARRAIFRGNYPIRCGWMDLFVPMVCCHPQQIQHPKIIYKPHSQIKF